MEEVGLEFERAHLMAGWTGNDTARVRSSEETHLTRVECVG